MTLALTIQRLFRGYETALPGEIGLVVMKKRINEEPLARAA